MDTLCICILLVSLTSKTSETIYVYTPIERDVSITRVVEVSKDYN